MHTLRLVDRRTDVLLHRKLGIDATLVLYSDAIKLTAKAAPELSGTFSLITDVDEVICAQREFTHVGDERGLLEWLRSRRDELNAKIKDSHNLDHYIKQAKDNSGGRAHILLRGRRGEIYGRLRTIGWKYEDMIFKYPHAEKWNALVGGTDQLTNDAWNLLLPKLIELLDHNTVDRMSRTVRSRIIRKLQHTRDWMVYLKRTTHPFAQILGALGIDLSHPLETFPDPFEVSCTLLQNPFPTDSHEVVFGNYLKNLVKASGCAEIDRICSERRTYLENNIVRWRNNLEEQLVDVFWAGAERETEIELMVKDSTGLTTDFAPNTRLLLRADTIFKRKSPPQTISPLYYPGFNCELSNADSAYHSLFGYRSHRSPSIKLTDARDHEQYTEAREIAKLMLKELHMPNATHFELLTMGRRFACARCHETRHTWLTILEHYLGQLCNWNLQHNDSRISAMRHPITHHNTHNPNPTESGQPLIHILPIEGVQSIPQHTDTAKEACLLCSFTEGVAFLSHLDHMAIHLRDVHDVARPVKGIHYGSSDVDSDTWLAKWDVFHELKSDGAAFHLPWE